MWLTEKKVGAYFRNKIVYVVGKIAKAAIFVLGAYELIDPWFDTISLLGGFCTLFVLEKRFLRADVIS
jgi:hypothetical protein